MLDGSGGDVHLSLAEHRRVLKLVVYPGAAIGNGPVPLQEAEHFILGRLEEIDKLEADV